MKKNIGYVGRNNKVKAVAQINKNCINKLGIAEKNPNTFNTIIMRKTIAIAKVKRCLLKYT